MKILFIGGTGQISFDCVHESVRQGHETYVFNRGSNNAGLPEAANFITGDMFDDEAYGKLAAMDWDVVCQFRVFTPSEMERDLKYFTGHVKQFIFISSASCYQKPPSHWLITEDMPLVNPYLQYSRDKAACEEVLTAQSEMSYTIVRPSHTSRTKIIDALGQGVLVGQRLLAGQPILVPGDGNSLWTITHSADFAKPFVQLFGNDKALGDHFTLTSDNAYTWNQIYAAFAKALGVTDYTLVHVSTDRIGKFEPEWAEGLRGDKGNTVVFDNSKIKAVVGDFQCPTSLDEFAEKIIIEVKKSGALDEPMNEQVNTRMDRIIAGL